MREGERIWGALKAPRETANQNQLINLHTRLKYRGPKVARLDPKQESQKARLYCVRWGFMSSAASGQSKMCLFFSFQATARQVHCLFVFQSPSLRHLHHSLYFMHINLDNSTKYNLRESWEGLRFGDFTQLDQYYTVCRFHCFSRSLRWECSHLPLSECETGGKDSVAEAEEEESTCWPSSKGDKK